MLRPWDSQDFVVSKAMETFPNDHIPVDVILFIALIKKWVDWY